MKDETPEKYLISQDPALRRAAPIGTAILDLFPAALEEMARTLRANNKTEGAIRWERSGDDADKLIRHFIERGGIDPSGVRHSAAVAIRALAILQEEMEREAGRKRPENSSRNALTPGQPSWGSVSAVHPHEALRRR